MSPSTCCTKPSVQSSQTWCPERQRTPVWPRSRILQPDTTQVSSFLSVMLRRGSRWCERLTEEIRRQGAKWQRQNTHTHT